jgi:hypothetical protein
MKLEARLLLKKASNSLIVAIEHFNRPIDVGRVTAVLILLDHAFEMLLKAAILHRGGRIREARKRETIGFDSCVRKGVSDPSIRYLTEEQAITLQTINGLRDAAQHHLIDISEQQLYIHAQSGVTLFGDLLRQVFNRNLIDLLPARVLPISTFVPNEIDMLFESEIKEVAKLLRPGRRRRTEALARIRPLAILDATIRGEKLQPSDKELANVAAALLNNKSWEEIFVGAASISFSVKHDGPNISLRIVKKEGIPIQLVPEGTAEASVVAIRRVDELGFYSLGVKQLAEKIGLSSPKTSALIWHLDLVNNPDCSKEIVIGKSKFRRYSQKAVDHLLHAKQTQNLESIWHAYRTRPFFMKSTPAVLD